MSTINTKRSWLSLVISHMSGMIDLAALPVWVGMLIALYAFMEAQAGLIVTLFLLGAVFSSFMLAPRFHKINGRVLAPLAFWISAAVFLVMTQVASFPALATLHFVAGAATGLGVSITHGTMGKTSNPHRIFAYGGAALSVAAVIYLGATPEIVKAAGREALFIVFAAIMGLAAVLGTLFFPKVEFEDQGDAPKAKFTKQVWLLIAAIMLMALNNSMILSFAERVGDHRGFAPEQVQMALIAMGVVVIFAPIAAVFLQKRLSTGVVATFGSVIHGLICLGIMTATEFPMYMAALFFLPSVIVFTHTFVFGTLAEAEPTGRAVAATPAMMMTGSAVGPFLGGAMVQTVGYAPLGMLAAAIGILSMILFIASTRQAAPASVPAE